jgi:hypothetical protein
MRESSPPTRIFTLLCLAAAAFFVFAPDCRAQDGWGTGSSASSDTVFVAAPTGKNEG